MDLTAGEAHWQNGAVERLGQDLENQMEEQAVKLREAAKRGDEAERKFVAHRRETAVQLREQAQMLQAAVQQGEEAKRELLEHQHTTEARLREQAGCTPPPQPRQTWTAAAT